MRRLYQGDRALADRGKRGLKEADFSDAGLLDKQLNQRANWPAPSR
jgi:hypothetical protein